MGRVSIAHQTNAVMPTTPRFYLFILFEKKVVILYLEVAKVVTLMHTIQLDPFIFSSRLNRIFFESITPI
jgi:hypothetical protein